jgi:AcrR family transcriptional regulator
MGKGRQGLDNLKQLFHTIVLNFCLRRFFPLEKTSERILNAAESVFGRKGFKAATIREICETAEVNLASVNYYFGNKTSLYRTVVSRLIKRMFDLYPADSGSTPDDSAEKRLKVFINAVLNRLLAPGGLSGFQGHTRLLAKEMADPSPILDDIIQGQVQPQMAFLMDIVKQFMGEKAQADQITRCVFSIIGQCFYYGLAWPIVTRIHPMDLSHPATIETLCEHITQFSLGALVHLNDLEQARNTAKKA